MFQIILYLSCDKESCTEAGEILSTLSIGPLQVYNSYSMHVQVELSPEKKFKKKRFFLKRNNISANHMISGVSKGVNSIYVWFTSSGKGCNRSHWKCMVKILIGHKYCVKRLNETIYNKSSSTANEPNFKNYP